MRIRSHLQLDSDGFAAKVKSQLSKNKVRYQQPKLTQADVNSAWWQVTLHCSMSAVTCQIFT
ncbi:hypothetical protein [Shewanella gelidii]|uniref:hypothetical protein n=1 Tax=Shewanella gelidii TaxID=1642821 RepID=UPI00166E91FB|nr:hypothetical protein [Shewanella gelidii]MCL1096707.1 hypothetical protein [Shewanella gelidii]